MPPELSTALKRMTEPPAQRRPSPKTVPDPPPVCAVPWKNSAELLGMSVPCSTSVSLDKCALPDPDKCAPAELTELAQPLPAAPLLPHGQAVPLPSPEQNVVPEPPPPETYCS